jgi:hypothetical protein
MRVMLLHKLAEHIPEAYVPPQKLIADVGKVVSDARDAGLLRMTGGTTPDLSLAAARREFSSRNMLPSTTWVIVVTP